MGLTKATGCISTSTGSSLGQIFTGSSLGQDSFEGGQLEGCVECSEPMGDHMMRGDGLGPGLKKKNINSLVMNSVCFAR